MRDIVARQRACIQFIKSLLPNSNESLPSQLKFAKGKSLLKTCWDL